MNISEETRATVLRRDGYRCLRCFESVMFTTGSIHHRKPRGMGGSRDPRINDLRNLVTLCGSGTTGCHGHIEANRAEAYADGWLLRSLDDLDTPMVVGSLVIEFFNGGRDVAIRHTTQKGNTQ